MDYVFLCCTVVFSTCQNILCAAYNRRNEGKAGATLPYTFLLIVSAFLCWIVAFAMDGQTSADVVIYSLLFAVCFTVAHWALANALRVGPLAITSLIVQLSLIGATVWGLLFWDAAFNETVLIGLALVVLALWLCLKKDSSTRQKSVSPIWLLYVVFAFSANAGCTIVQKTQQINFDGSCGAFCMLLAVGMSAVSNGVSLYGKRGTIDWECLKKNWIFPVLAGVSNGLLNLFVIFLAAGELSPGLIYPVIAVGSLSVTTICSACVFGEKMSLRQWLGIIVGAAGVLALSL